MKASKLISTMLVMLCLSGIIQQAQAQQPGSSANKTYGSAEVVGLADSLTHMARGWRGRRAGFSLMPSSLHANASGGGAAITAAAASPPAVLGNGTVGRISMWTGTSPSGNSVLGDSIITQLNGNIGVGTATPASKLTVQGMIETTLGGYKFPDGTVQTTAAVSGLTSVIRDGTLTGDGTSGAPLGVAVPLILSGSDPSNSILSVTNTAMGAGLFDGSAVFGKGHVGTQGVGNDYQDSFGGTGVVARGGDSGSSAGGNGIFARGGNSESLNGGAGILVNGGSGLSGGLGIVVQGGSGLVGAAGVGAAGGSGTNGTGGSGLLGSGGTSSNGLGGDGVSAIGGRSLNGNGGAGVRAGGGDGNGVGSHGGAGIVARKGSGIDGATIGLAGDFIGDVEISENLNVTGTKNFKIDHPLDPENKYLLHAAIESSEVLNVYSGNVTTDASGDATVTLPEWFEALNKDFRYQLTVVGTFAQAIVASEVQDNRFTVKTTAPNVKVSWQITGVRSDKAMKNKPFKAEENKPRHERGHYLRPELYDQPKELGIEWARHPEMMRELEKPQRRRE
jgi:trimeric autotransporter adhesin